MRILRPWCAFCAGAIAAHAHFQLLIPSTDVLGDPKHATIALDVKFAHPMEGRPVMNMDKPLQFGVWVDGKKNDLLGPLQSVVIEGRQAFKANYTVLGPGVHIFYVEPRPYWEPEERKYIKHYTKVVVGAFGLFEGWDAAVGFPVEIKPLSRPFGLWTGNVFRGILVVQGKPAADATVEIEYYNEPRQVEAPNDAFVTQETKTDANGVFEYAIPRAGWWGFAALTQGIETLPGPDGAPAPVESGASIWVRAVDMK